MAFQVRRAMVEECVDDVIPVPTAAADWDHIILWLPEGLNFPQTLGALAGKHI